MATYIIKNLGYKLPQPSQSFCKQIDFDYFVALVQKVSEPEQADEDSVKLAEQALLILRQYAEKKEVLMLVFNTDTKRNKLFELLKELYQKKRGCDQIVYVMSMFVQVKFY